MKFASAPLLILLVVVINFWIYFKILNKVQNPKKCEINVENLANLLRINRNSSSLVQKLQNPFENANENQTVNTIQTQLYALYGGGGLGNILFELISLRGIASLLNRTPTINADRWNIMGVLIKKIQPVFPRLVEQYQFKLIPKSKIRVVQESSKACCIFDDPERMAKLTDPNLYLQAHYLQSFKYFDHLKNDVRNWLTPNVLTQVRADTLLPEPHQNDFIICTHVRRGDFATDGLHRPSDGQFTRLATDYLVHEYQKTHDKLHIVVMGNDPVWSYSIFYDRTPKSDIIVKPNIENAPPIDSPEYNVTITPTLTPETDLAFSARYCDVVLITAPSSTFGWWLGYLSKEGSVVYYRSIVESKDGVIREMNEEDFFPPSWIKLETSVDTNEIKKAKFPIGSF